MNGERSDFALFVRVPTTLVERVDGLAAMGGLSRSQLVRLALSRLTEDDIPREMIQHAEALRPNAARAM